MAKLLVCILIASVVRFVPISAILDNSLGSGTKQSAGEMIEKSHLIRHVSTTKCMVLDNPKGHTQSGDYVVLWDCFDRLNNALESEMYVMTKSNGGGYMIMGSSGSINKCLHAGREYYDPLMTYNCDPDNADLSWLTRKIDGTTDMYQIVQRSTDRCLRTPELNNGATIRVGDCDVNDAEQSWRICKYDGTCDF